MVRFLYIILVALFVLPLSPTSALPSARNRLQSTSHTLYLPLITQPLALEEFDVTNQDVFYPLLEVGPSIHAGADGTIWFAAGVKLGRMTPNGTLSIFAFGTRTSPVGMTIGPDGLLWISTYWQHSAYISRYNMAGQYVDSVSAPSGIQTLGDITLGSDGNIWVAANSAIFRVTPELTTTTYFLPEWSSGGFVNHDITVGPDSNLWFTQIYTNKIGRITPAGVITEFPLPTADSQPLDIVSGPDGNLWFTQYGANRIGRITPAGVVTEFPLPTPESAPYGITSGSDGNLWFTQSNVGKIGRITPTGSITEFPLPLATGRPTGITTSSDGNLWFTETDAKKIGKIDLRVR